MKNTIQENIKDRHKKRTYKLAKDNKNGANYHINRALENYLDELKVMRKALYRLINDRVLTQKTP